MLHRTLDIVGKAFGPGNELLLLMLQGSYRQVGVKFKDFSRTSKDYATVFKDLKFIKNPYLSLNILLQKC